LTKTKNSTKIRTGPEKKQNDISRTRIILSQNTDKSTKEKIMYKKRPRRGPKKVGINFNYFSPCNKIMSA
jgi:hypothetical protein